jgi:hypothetical protein
VINFIQHGRSKHDESAVYGHDDRSPLNAPGCDLVDDGCDLVDYHQQASKAGPQAVKSCLK